MQQAAEKWVVLTWWALLVLRRTAKRFGLPIPWLLGPKLLDGVLLGDRLWKQAAQGWAGGDQYLTPQFGEPQGRNASIKSPPRLCSRMEEAALGCLLPLHAATLLGTQGDEQLLVKRAAKGWNTLHSVPANRPRPGWIQREDHSPIRDHLAVETQTIQDHVKLPGQPPFAAGVRSWGHQVTRYEIEEILALSSSGEFAAKNRENSLLRHPDERVGHHGVSSSRK